MKLLLKEAIRKVDAKAIKAVGLTELVLMQTRTLRKKLTLFNYTIISQL